MIRKLLASSIALASFMTYASDFGLSYTNLLVAKDPSHANGYRAAITYQPKAFVWQRFNVYFDGGYSHWWVSDNQPNKTISIYSVAPYFRYYPIKTRTISPYLEASVGLSYMTETRFGKRNLGIHFAFQDILGMGFAYGPEQRLYTTLGALHYSNARFSSHNSGITVPLFITVGYRF